MGVIVHDDCCAARSDGAVSHVPEKNRLEIVTVTSVVSGAEETDSEDELDDEQAVDCHDRLVGRGERLWCGLNGWLGKSWHSGHCFDFVV